MPVVKIQMYYEIEVCGVGKSYKASCPELFSDRLYWQDTTKQKAVGRATIAIRCLFKDKGQTDIPFCNKMVPVPRSMDSMEDIYLLSIPANKGLEVTD